MPGELIKVTMCVSNGYFTYEFTYPDGRHHVGYVTVGGYGELETVQLIKALNDSASERHKGEGCFMREFSLQEQCEFYWLSAEVTEDNFQDQLAHELISHGDGPAHAGRTMLAIANGVKLITTMHIMMEIIQQDFLNTAMTPNQYLNHITHIIAETKAALKG